MVGVRFQLIFIFLVFSTTIVLVFLRVRLLDVERPSVAVDEAKVGVVKCDYTVRDGNAVEDFLLVLVELDGEVFDQTEVPIVQ